MSQPIQFIMLGGFLGAGKTTLISKLAKRFQADGKHVGVVTNDQAAGLVDTHLLQSQGLDVNEVAGSCFCCNYNGLTGAMSEFETRHRPDVILVEPVGSCTDLIATIAVPMMQQLGEQFTHSPYAVLLKPSHGLRILSGKGGGFSAKAEYIFRKQLEESELVVINRIDELSATEVKTLQEAIEEQYPGRRTICVSAHTEANLEELYAALQTTAQFPAKMMEVDYDIYADGEAELGWLNAGGTLVSDTPISQDALTVALVDRLRTVLLAVDAEPAHIKVLVSSGSNVSVANLVSSDSQTMLSVASDQQVTQAEVIVNARVCLSPGQLKGVVTDALDRTATDFAARISIDQMEAFRPGRPVPTHRATST
ncbi:GTPase, G3E family [Neorhodopirellula lusitana]|uniref:GTPase, G3E family n=1 Tax=Neorhodopirellula lusitana TaxID=445327 RepID=A0ABY1PNC4_9BACT|nr:GTP-binding protein [Neorhodopirellula lusitana]SMP38422.1 GTPase, G3E family [Neorhodopirellula lusitana]